MPINYTNKKQTRKMDNFCVLLTFLLIIISRVIIVGFYYYSYHTIHRYKQKQILTYFHRNNKFKEINITNTMKKKMNNNKLKQIDLESHT